MLWEKKLRKLNKKCKIVKTGAKLSNIVSTPLHHNGI